MAASAVLALLLASALAGAAAGGDIVHQDDQAPKIPGCSNDFVLVMRPQHGAGFSVKELNSISWNVGENPQIILCRDGKIKKVEHLFQQLDRPKLEPNASTFSALILGHCKTQKSERALQLLNVMKKSGFHLNYDTYKIVISTFCKNKDFEGAVDVMKELLEMCMAPDKVLLHEFFEALSKAKKLHLAEDLQSADKSGKFIPSIYYTGDYRNKGEE
ncbi:pentatricopeptide repeat-containing protein [Hordeum vulgare]|nr:pentatricopeptide repeat-containing protein [Hordeum vulgare]